jgi:hypothetical protein
MKIRQLLVHRLDQGGRFPASPGARERRRPVPSGAVLSCWVPIDIDQTRGEEMNGTYAFVFCGDVGVGIGIFKVDGSDLVGADYGGVKYRGIVSQEPVTGEVKVDFEMFVPAGVNLVQGTSPLNFNATKRSAFTAPPNFGDGKPFDAYIAPGDVKLMVKRVPDQYSIFIDGFEIVPRPRPPE